VGGAEMRLPTLEDLKKLTRIRLPAGNKIPYGHDFSFYSGIPSDVDWYIHKVENGTASLVRLGYGVERHYGGGCLLVKAEHLGVGA
jgi:hypothetical protein